uniref:Uncharacterized protein n=1 Tax=Rhizophora mucronata TaxID=61149 RepID=A0A2P2IHG7_RHIMU
MDYIKLQHTSSRKIPTLLGWMHEQKRLYWAPDVHN